MIDRVARNNPVWSLSTDRALVPDTPCWVPGCYRVFDDVRQCQPVPRRGSRVCASRNKHHQLCPDTWQLSNPDNLHISGKHIRSKLHSWVVLHGRLGLGYDAPYRRNQGAFQSKFEVVKLACTTRLEALRRDPQSCRPLG